MMIGAYNYLDITPKGRNEDGLAFKHVVGSAHHDRYAEATRWIRRPSTSRLRATPARQLGLCARRTCPWNIVLN